MAQISRAGERYDIISFLISTMNNQIQKADMGKIIMPAVSADEAVAAWKQYEELKRKIASESDIQKIQGKDFLKKSYWRKIATFFNLTTEIVEEKHEQIGDTLIWHFTVKAIGSNGRFAIGVGSCDSYEKAVLMNGQYLTKGEVTKWGKTSSGKSYPMDWEWIPATPNSIHNVRSTAETRATNRAISNLVGGGEVSAEEVDADSYLSDDKTSNNAPTKAPSKILYINDFQKGKLVELGAALGYSEEGIKEYLVKSLKAESFDKITLQKAGDTIISMQKKVDEKKKEIKDAEVVLDEDEQQETKPVQSEKQVSPEDLVPAEDEKEPDPTDEWKSEEKEEPAPLCALHKVPMKNRGKYWEHCARLNDKKKPDENGLWHYCQGTGWKLSINQSS